MAVQLIGTYTLGETVRFYANGSKASKVAPTKYGYTAPSLSNGQAKVTIYRVRPNLLQKPTDNATATLSGSNWWTAEASYSSTPGYGGPWVAIFSWKLNDVQVFAVSLCYIYDPVTAADSDGSGEVASIADYNTPAIQHVIWQTADGHLVAKQSPY